jgi:hypothetical protein
MRAKKPVVLKKGKKIGKTSTLGARADFTPIQMPHKV